MELKIPKQLDVNKISGDFESQEAGIDSSSMPFVFEMLSKNLYSNPIGSIVREITSNCFDSHIEANVNEPVVISKLEDEEGIYISFKDVGVGLSPERIKKIYLNYFSSTKRENNNQIGGFGLGSKTPFAYSDYFYITTIFDGIKYSYIFSKGEFSPLLDLLSEEKTEEHNGTEIKIYIKDNYNDIGLFKQNLKEQLSYFDNVYFINWDIENDYIIYETNNFKYRNKDRYSDELHIILGKVSYPVDWNKLKIKQIKIPIGIKFEIGELQVTPNREAIRYSIETEALINTRINNTIEELTSMFQEQNKPITSFIAYSQINNKKPFIYFDKNNIENSKLYLVGLNVDKKYKFSPYETLPELYEINNFKCENLFRKLYKGKFNILNNKSTAVSNCGITLDDLYEYKLSESGRDTQLKNWYHKRGSVIIRNKIESKDLKLLFINQVGKKKKIEDEEENDIQLEYNNNNLYPFTIPSNNFNAYTGSNGTWYHDSNTNQIINTIHPLQPYTNDWQVYNLATNIINEDNKQVFGSKYYFNLGSAKKLYLIIKGIRKEIESHLVGYDNIPDDALDRFKEEKKSKDNNYQRKLNKKIFIKHLSDNTQQEWALSEIENYKGIIVYGFRNDLRKLTEAICILGQFKTLIIKESKYYYPKLNSKAAKVIQISQSNEKHFKGNKNMCHVDKLCSDNKIFRKLASSIKIEDYFRTLLKYQRIDVEEYNNRISEICKPVGDLLKKLTDYMNNIKEVDEIQGSLIKRRDIKDDIIKLATERNLFDPIIDPIFKQLDKWFEGVELIKFVEINDENIKYILICLKEKKKKLNQEYYIRWIRPELIKAQTEFNFDEKIETKFQVLTN